MIVAAHHQREGCGTGSFELSDESPQERAAQAAIAVARRHGDGIEFGGGAVDTSNAVSGNRSAYLSHEKESRRLGRILTEDGGVPGAPPERLPLNLKDAFQIVEMEMPDMQSTRLWSRYYKGPGTANLVSLALSGHFVPF